MANKMDKMAEVVGEYRIIGEKPLGKGSFGTVYKVCKNGASDVENGKAGVIYAMKRISLKDLLPKDRKHCQDELTWMQNLLHRNIIKYHDSFEIGNEINIVMEYCGGGSLRDYIQKVALIPETKCLEIMEQTCAGLKFLHDQKIIHRDIKPGNIFLQGQIVKLGDLALLKLLETPAFVAKMTMKVGTLAYMSPEMIAGDMYGLAADIWSLGCCIYEIAMKRIPYLANTEVGVERKIRTEQASFEGFPYNTKIRKLLEQMLNKNASNRPTIETVSKQIRIHLRQIEQETDTNNRTVSLYESEKGPTMEVPNNPDISRQRLTATFPGNRPKSSEKKLTELAASNISETETNEIASARQRRKKTKTKVVYIPVKVSEDEYNMMNQADYLQQVLERDYLSDVELEKMFRHLERNMEENEFLDEMKLVVGAEKFKGAKPFLMSLWLFKTPLLRRNYKMICKKADN